MEKSEVRNLFKTFSQKHPEPLRDLGEFINEVLKPLYYQKKEKFYKKQGLQAGEARNKSRQSWVAFLGGVLEDLLTESLESFCKNHNVKITTDKALKRRELSKELDFVRRSLEVHFDDYSLLPDADIIIYQASGNNTTTEIIAILSVKNSFRERFTETPYWKLKLSQNPHTANIKVFMITPDNDSEISIKGNQNGPRKARIVMEYELDGIFLARKDFDSSEKVKGIELLQEDLLKLF